MKGSGKIEWVHQPKDMVKVMTESEGKVRRWRKEDNSPITAAEAVNILKTLAQHLGEAVKVWMEPV